MALSRSLGLKLRLIWPFYRNSKPIYAIDYVPPCGLKWTLRSQSIYSEWWPNSCHGTPVKPCFKQIKSTTQKPFRIKYSPRQKYKWKIHKPAQTHIFRNHTHTISLSQSLWINAVIICQQEASCLQLRYTWRQNKMLSSYRKTQEHKTQHNAHNV